MALQKYIRSEMEKGILGEPANNSPLNSGFTGLNDSPRTQQVSTIVVDAAANSTEYAVEIDGIEITYTSDGTATVLEIVNGLKAAIEAEGLVSGRLSVTSNGVDTLTLTARVGGVGFDLSDADANLTTATTTANDEADPLYFGRAVMANLAANNALDSVMKLKAVSNFTQQVINLTPAAVNSATYFVEVRYDGVGYLASYLADGTATVQEIVEGLQLVLAGILPAAVVATEDNTKLILTAATKGDSFEASAGSNAATATWTITNSLGMATSVDLGLVGIANYDATREVNEDGTVYYPGNSAVAVQYSGFIVAEVESAPTSIASAVYVRVAANGALDKIGAFSASAGTGLVKCRNLAWFRRLSAGKCVVKFK